VPLPWIYALSFLLSPPRLPPLSPPPMLLWLSFDLVRIAAGQAVFTASATFRHPSPLQRYCPRLGLLLSRKASPLLWPRRCISLLSPLPSTRGMHCNLVGAFYIVLKLYRHSLPSSSTVPSLFEQSPPLCSLCFAGVLSPFLGCFLEIPTHLLRY